MGSGHDLVVYDNLDSGYAYGYSYCDNPSSNCHDSTTGNILGIVGDHGFDSIGALEVFTISAFEGGVPAPGALALLGFGLLGLGMRRRTA